MFVRLFLLGLFFLLRLFFLSLEFLVVELLFFLFGIEPGVVDFFVAEIKVDESFS